MDIERLSLEQLFDLNRQVVGRIEHLQGLKTRANLARFQVGDRVSFPSEGRQIEGIVIRVNQKTISIKTKDSYWRIHPRFLTKLPGPKAVIPQDVLDIIERQAEP